MPLNLEVLRELTPEDLTAPVPVGAKARAQAQAQVSPLERVRAIHHAQARMIAQGTKIGAVSAALGTSRATLESLLLDPTFQELVVYYADQLDVIYLTTHEEASLLARMAMGELRERLETQPGKFSDNQLREIAIAMLDRTDLPPKTNQATPVTAPVITFNFGGIGNQPANQVPQIEAVAEPATVE